jgi:mRNA interferase RelE/StbE
LREYRLLFLEAAIQDLSKLDNSIRKRIYNRMEWLAATLDSTKPQPLVGEFSGLHKFRVGDFRVVYEISREQGSILVHGVGHRREIYRTR